MLVITIFILTDRLELSKGIVSHVRYVGFNLDMWGATEGFSQ